MNEKHCVLEEEKLCVECGRCNVCDLDPDKICDNCMRCINRAADYACIAIDGVFTTQDVPDEDDGIYTESD